MAYQAEMLFGSQWVNIVLGTYPAFFFCNFRLENGFLEAYQVENGFRGLPGGKLPFGKFTRREIVF